MSLLAARTPETSRRGGASPRFAVAAPLRRFGHWLQGLWQRPWQRLATRRRFHFPIKVLVVLVLLTAPLWTLNMTVAMLGRSVIFPLSPFFLREKLSALGSYARHRSSCTAHDHQDTDQIVKRAELRHRLPRGLLAAVVHVESRGFAHRISAAGAMGPGQLMPDTARELGVDDPFDTADNVDGAARLLSGHLGRYHHNLRLAVAAYHAGAGAVRGHVPNNGQTPGYVTKVMHTYATLRPRPAITDRSPARRPAHGKPPPGAAQAL